MGKSDWRDTESHPSRVNAPLSWAGFTSDWVRVGRGARPSDGRQAPTRNWQIALRARLPKDLLSMIPQHARVGGPPLIGRAFGSIRAPPTSQGTEHPIHIFSCSRYRAIGKVTHPQLQMLQQRHLPRAANTASTAFDVVRKHSPAKSSGPPFGGDSYSRPITGNCPIPGIRNRADIG